MNSSEMLSIFYMNTLGLSIIHETMKMAAKMSIPYYKRHTGGEVMECYMWVQGTGLDMFIEQYEMDYDAEKLRNSFNWYLRKHEEQNICHYLSS